MNPYDCRVPSGIAVFSAYICCRCLAGTAYILTEAVVLSIQMYLAKHMLRAFVVHLSE